MTNRSSPTRWRKHETRMQTHGFSFEVEATPMEVWKALHPRLPSMPEGEHFVIEHGEVRIHGRDERLAVKSFAEGTEFLHRLVKALAAGD